LTRLGLVLYVSAFLLASASTVFYFVPFYQFWVLVTSVGSTEFYVAVLPVVYHALPRAAAMGLALSLLAAATTAGLLKDILKLSRPPEDLWRVGAEGYGFPSGHATGSTAFWGYLSIYRASAPLVAFSAVMIVPVSASRVVLGVHYPRDVLGGVLLGVVAATLSYLAVKALDSTRLAAAGAAVGVAGLALHHLGLGELEPPSALLGIAVGELVCGRLSLTGRAGWRYGVLGSVLALAVGIPALRLGHPIASPTLMALAGFLAVLAPRLAWSRLGGGRWQGGF